MFIEMIADSFGVMYNMAFNDLRLDSNSKGIVFCIMYLRKANEMYYRSVSHSCTLTHVHMYTQMHTDTHTHTRAHTHLHTRR